MNNREKPTNPWNRNQPQQQRGQKKQRHNAGNVQALPTPSEIKFKEAQVKLQAAVQKHAKDYESSSEEDELESENLIGDILKSYSQVGGKDEHLGRTKAFLQESLSSGTAICLICISRIKRTNAIWNCCECYCCFHLDCIQKWSKDNIFQQKLLLEGPIQVHKVTLTWSCPKCRNDYTLEDIPYDYRCFCQKRIDPELQTFLVPHSCGEICKKDLKPKCGHQCMLLCHPGPCPPCPVTVSVDCYCSSQSKIQRCSNKEWSCGNICGKLLKCGKHSCSDPCHPMDCKPCPKKSLQKCLCKSEQKLRDCATPIWQCDKVCNKPLQCGNHTCSTTCHEGDCESCPLSKPRTCPCGKNGYELPCTEETPTCMDTCEKLLVCGEHNCNQRCHKDKCGVCLVIVKKSCRCGQHSKEVQCHKQYLCETKCKQIKDCNKHPCNRKCCDGDCPPCEKPCGRTLSCGNHKCNSVCHRGSCFPCNQTETVSCACGCTRLIVACGRKHKTKPPKCIQLCRIPPECHHVRQVPHKCHFGSCPPCKQVCNKEREECSHPCQAPCHSSVVVKIEGEKPSMPWERTEPQLEKKALPCPDCVVPIAVTCLGGHETCNWPCHKAQPTSCHRPCGRLLSCENHTCTIPCHLVEEVSTDPSQAGSNCEVCENMCSKPRPEGCQHDCPKACHPGPCPPCKQMQRIKCHCGLTQPYVSCFDFLNVTKRDELQSCGNQCPKNYVCGHRCRANCHPGPCPNSELCKKKVKVTCSCKRLKKEFQCEMVRNNQAKVDCDEVCVQKIEEARKEKQALNEQKKKEEELKNKKELEKYQKIFEGKKKNRERRVYKEDEEIGFFRKYLMIIVAVLVCFGAVGAYFSV